MSTSLLTELEISQVGQSFDLAPITILANDVERYIVASGDSLAWMGQGGQTQNVPPLLYKYIGAVRGYGSATNPDGSFAEHRILVGDGKLMAGEIDVQFTRPLRIGDELRGVRTLVSLEEKQGKTRGNFVVSTWETIYRDQQGSPVIVETYRQILS